MKKFDNVPDTAILTRSIYHRGREASTKLMLAPATGAAVGRKGQAMSSRFFASKSAFSNRCRPAVRWARFQKAAYRVATHLASLRPRFTKIESTAHGREVGDLLRGGV